MANCRLLRLFGAWAIIENLYATFWGDVYWTNGLLPVCKQTKKEKGEGEEKETWRETE